MSYRTVGGNNQQTRRVKVFLAFLVRFSLAAKAILKRCDANRGSSPVGARV